MNKAITKLRHRSVVLNVIIGIVAVAAVGWLVMSCTTCH